MSVMPLSIKLSSISREAGLLSFLNTSENEDNYGKEIIFTLLQNKSESLCIGSVGCQQPPGYMLVNIDRTMNIYMCGFVIFTNLEPSIGLFMIMVKDCTEFIVRLDGNCTLYDSTLLSNDSILELEYIKNMYCLLESCAASGL
uniref:Uncharacterized protein n=1 Tax=Glossina brevipalpis TaxID=37001 RepID=A0A1A9WQR4_9MUSC